MKLLLFISINLCCISALAQWTTIPMPTGYALNEIEFVNDTTGFIIGDSILGLSQVGKTFKTSDKGLTFFENDFYFAAFKSISIGDNQTLYVNGIDDNQEGVLRKTTSQGNIWSTVGTIVPHGQLSFINAQEGFIAGQGTGHADAWATYNGGFNWVQLTGSNGLGISAILDLQFLNADTGYVGGLYGPLITKTTDQGSNWVVTCDTFATRSLTMIDGFRGYFVGNTLANDGIIRTNDGGNSFNWVLDYTTPGRPFTFTPSSIYCNDVNTCMCSSTDGWVATTYDGGLNWAFEYTGTPAALTDIYFNDEYAIAIGLDGVVLRKQLLSNINDQQDLKQTISFKQSENEMSIKNNGEDLLLVIVYDAVGKWCINKEVKKNETIVFSTEEFSKGIYFVKCQIKNRTATYPCTIR